MTSFVLEFGETFLVEPARFPRAAEGRPFGPNRLDLRIADHHVAVSGMSREQADAMQSLWRDFATPPAGAAIPVDVFRTEAGRFRPIDRAGWSYELDFDHGASGTRIAGLDLMARLDWAPDLGGALWTSAERPAEFHGALENFLRVLFAHATLSRGGALLHSAAVVEDGRALLFVGPSGAGKSTLARLALESGREVASDDLNPVVPDARTGVMLACGSPFLGDLGARAPGSRVLAGIFRLEKGPADAVRPMSPAEAVASLVACAPFVNVSPYLDDLLWRNLSRLAARVPCRVLTFRREGTFWPLLAT